MTPHHSNASRNSRVKSRSIPLSAPHHSAIHPTHPANMNGTLPEELLSTVQQQILLRQSQLNQLSLFYNVVNPLHHITTLTNRSPTGHLPKPQNPHRIRSRRNIQARDHRTRVIKESHRVQTNRLSRMSLPAPSPHQDLLKGRESIGPGG